MHPIVSQNSLYKCYKFMINLKRQKELQFFYITTAVQEVVELQLFLTWNSFYLEQFKYDLGTSGNP